MLQSANVETYHIEKKYKNLLLFSFSKIPGRHNANSSLADVFQNVSLCDTATMQTLLE